MGSSAGPKKTTSNLIFAYDMNSYRSWKGAPTTNIIPSGTINSYPSVGNSWGTFSTNQYNSNTYFSIGTISSVTGNLVTLATTDTAIYTYDILQPETTGGGVTAGTYYQVLKHSATTFSLHTPDTTADGSIGFGAYDDIIDDTRVSINATSFPTSWKGPPHRPNAASVKEIRPNGFNWKGRKHDYVRVHTEHKPNAFDDYMAYGVTPSVTNAVTYSYGFKFRAADDNSVGRTISPQMYTTTNWSNPSPGTTAAATREWQQHTYTGTAPATGTTFLYFSISGTGGAMDISEIHMEAGSTLSEYQPGTAARTNTEALLDFTGNQTITANSLTYASDNTFSFNGTSDYLSTDTMPSFTAADEFSVECVIKPDSATTDMRFITPGGLGIDRWLGTTTGGKLILQLTQAADTGGRGFQSSTSISTTEYQHWVVTVNGTDINFYLNGSLDSNQTDSSGFSVGQWGGYAWYIGQRSNSTFWFDGEIPLVAAYDGVLTAGQVKANFLGIRNQYGI